MTAEEETRLWKSLETMVDRDLDDWERGLYESERREMLTSMWKDREYQRLRDKLEQYEDEYDGSIPVKLDEKIHLALRKYNLIRHPDLEMDELIQKIIDQHLKFAEYSTPGFVYS